MSDARLQPIRMILTDVDGVLTDGRIQLDANTFAETKSFHVHDAAGIVYWHRSGGLSGFLSGRSAPVVERRAQELGVIEVHLGFLDKEPILDRILERHQLKAEQVAYIGDDLLDLPVLQRVGYSVAPPEARPDVLSAVDYVTRVGAGFGVMREVIELVMQAQGTWQRVVDSSGKGKP